MSGVSAMSSPWVHLLLVTSPGAKMPGRALAGRPLVPLPFLCVHSLPLGSLAVRAHIRTIPLHCAPLYLASL